jgi:hypothetical protein
MTTDKKDKLTRKEQREESAGINTFLTFADELSKSLNSRKKSALDEQQTAALRHVYNRLEREMKRRAESGRPKISMDEVIQEIADKIVWKGKKASVLDGGTLSDLCKAKGTNYKTFWRRWNNKESLQNKYSLANQLNEIQIIRRLADGEPVKGKKKRANFDRVVLIVRGFQAKAQTRKSNLEMARSVLEEKRGVKSNKF